jgi:hypothetical protein
MGLYDTFLLKTPIQCRNCYAGGYRDFQTKDLGECMVTYVEGEPAVMYGTRNINEEEKEKRHEYFMMFHPKSAGTPWEDLFGMFRQDKSVIINRLPDGIYETYTWCPICKSMMYVPMEVKGGIFVGAVSGNE